MIQLQMVTLALKVDQEPLDITRVQDQTIQHHRLNHLPLQHPHPHPHPPHNNHQHHVQEPNVQEPNVQEPSVQEPQHHRHQHHQPLVSIIYFVHVLCKLCFYFQNHPINLAMTRHAIICKIICLHKQPSM